MYIEKYFETYPKIKEYMDNSVANCKEKGYVKGLGYVRGNGGDYHCYKVIINGNKFTINYNSNKYHHSGTYQHDQGVGHRIPD